MAWNNGKNTTVARDPLGTGTYGLPMWGLQPSSDGYTGTQMDWGQSAVPAAPTKDWSAGYGFTGEGGFTGNGLPVQKSGWDLFTDKLLGKVDEKGIKTEGLGGLGLNALSSLGNAWLGMKQLQLGRDTLDQNKQQFDMNWGAQKATTNSALEDRQRARVASNAGAYQSVGDYMNKNGIK